MANFSPNDPGYRGPSSSSSAASNFAASEGLSSPAAVNNGFPRYNGPDPNGVLVVEDSGKRKWVTPIDVGADASTWGDNKYSMYNELYTGQKSLQKENFERYTVATGNGTYARILYDKDSKNGYSASYNSDLYLKGDNNNVLYSSYGVNEGLAQQYFNKYPNKVGTLTVPEAAKLFLDETGAPSTADELKAARDAWNRGGGGGGGRITTVSRVREITGQQLRGEGNPAALNSMGRTLGVDEADEVVKGLNKESRKNPEVTTGLGTSNQKTKGGYDFRQGLEDAINGTADGEAYQKVTRGIDLLNRALGGMSS